MYLSKLQNAFVKVKRLSATSLARAMGIHQLWIVFVKIAKYICQNHTVLTRIFTCDFEGGRCCVRGNELLVGLRGWTQKVKSGRTSFLIVGKNLASWTCCGWHGCAPLISYSLYPLISDQIWFLYHLMLFHCCLLVLHDFKAKQVRIINLI